MATTKTVVRNGEHDEFCIGVLSVLSIVYLHDAETIAEEIVTAVGGDNLLRVAKANGEPCLPRLRKTVKFLKERGSR